MAKKSRTSKNGRTTEPTYPVILTGVGDIVRLTDRIVTLTEAELCTVTETLECMLNGDLNEGDEGYYESMSIYRKFDRVRGSIDRQRAEAHPKVPLRNRRTA